MAETLIMSAMVQQALAGERAAWDRIVERLYPWALGVARRRLPRGISPEDAVQEAFLIAYAKLPDLRQHAALPAWLASIICSQCMRQVLDHPPGQSLDQLAEAGLLPPDMEPGPEDAFAAMQLFEAFDAALERLPRALREVCRLHYRRGLSVPEVAAACALPEGTVKKRLFTARPHLQEPLARFRSPGLFRVGYMPISDHLLAMCAERLNQGRGLPLLSRRYLSWSALGADLERGRLDAAFIMAPIALSLRHAGAPLVYVLDGHHDGSSVCVSTSPVRHRCLGLPDAHSTHAVFLPHIALEHPQLNCLPTTIVNPSAAPASIRHNAIGGFFCAEPWSAKCASLGLGERLLRSADVLPGHLCCILAVRREFAARRGEELAAYVRLLLRARDRVRRDVGFAAAAQAACTGIESGLCRRVLEDRAVSFEDLEPDQGRMDALARMARDAGVLPPECSAEGFARPEFAATS
jgi:NitT/TauT family transport system substrate-binding protein